MLLPLFTITSMNVTLCMSVCANHHMKQYSEVKTATFINLQILLKQ